MRWQNKIIVNIKRSFLDTNGVSQKNDVEVVSGGFPNPFKDNKQKINKETWLNVIYNINCASQKGLVEQFDSSIGVSTVLMPFGGKYQETPVEASVQKYLL
nr:hypothetical protein [endosymbiont 'TC1' of Trimyema compressum]